MNKDLNVFIQARMSSSRYPGKILAPVNGEPLIKNLLDRTKKLSFVKDIVVVTSSLASDDPLVSYLKTINCSVFRGDLHNVFGRFQGALKIYPSHYCMRLCADSPFIDVSLMQFMINKAHSGYFSLISNVFSRTFPKGQSVEIINSQLVLRTDSKVLTRFEQEHVMPYFYKNLDHNHCLFFELTRDYGSINQCVDTIDDLKSIDKGSYRFDPKQIREVSLEQEKRAVV